ncbi:MAG: ferredoxin-type protein NapF [Methylophaga sp.]|nr:ferredoxin-type protein NapF [Methylophaga sp.]
MAERSHSSRLSRSAFLQGAWREDKMLIRPPWATDEGDFLSSCDSRCKSCVDACPEKIIVIGRGNYPHIDFSKGECTFCEQCVDSCNYHALVKQPDGQPWLHKAVINMDKCITQQSVVCRSCSEMCEAVAIKFHPVVGGVSSPELNSDLCNGCGACISVCPTTALFISPLDDVDQGALGENSL